MFNRLNGMHKSAHGVPNLVVSQRVLDKMTAAAAHSLEDETGEAMVGLVVPGTHTNGIPTVYVLDTISPDESAIRQFHTFQQGDDRQDELIWWLQENWQQSRKTHAQQPKWDVPLRYLGDWHKQPGFMVQPSGGDLLTALDWLDDPDNRMDFLIAPIVTLGHTHTNASATVNYLTAPQPDGTALRVDFWYIDGKTRQFQPVAPTLYPAPLLPKLVEYPWHLLDESRVAAEMRALEDDGLFISLTLWDADGQPPLEICFLTARMGAEKMLILVTSADYPQTPPYARVAPFLQMEADDDMYDVFASAWAQSEPVTYAAQWTGEMLLVDYVHALEAHLGLAKPNSTEAEENS
jgi:hypothetical protein